MGGSKKVEFGEGGGAKKVIGSQGRGRYQESEKEAGEVGGVKKVKRKLGKGAVPRK